MPFRKLVLLVAVSLLAVQSIAQVPQHPRVFLVNHDSLEAGAVGLNQVYVRPASSEQIKDLASQCPQITITSVREKADIVVDWTLKTWNQTSWSGYQNEFAIYNLEGDVIATGHAHRASGAANDICKLIQQKWQPRALDSK